MTPPSTIGPGRPFKTQTKEVLHKIYTYFESEIAKDPNATVTAAQLVSHSTGISIHAIKRLFVDNKPTTKTKKAITPAKKYQKNITNDEYDAQAIRRILHNFYTNQDDFPFMRDLYLMLKAEIDYQGTLGTLRKHVAKLGFGWMEKEDHTSIMIEKHECRYTRLQYLTKIEEYRSQGRNIVYTGEFAIDSSRTSSKPRPYAGSTTLKQPAKSRLIILLAGDQQDVMKNTLHVYDGSKRQYKEEVEGCKGEHFEQYEKWFKFHVIPKLLPDSIVIIDGGSAFHNRISNSIPQSNARKKEMVDWLTARNVPFSPDMYKPQLYQLILLNRDKHIEYKTDTMLREHGHTALRLPPYYPDLSPIKNLLLPVKSYVGDDTGFLTLQNIMKIAKEKILSFTSNDWKNAYRTAKAEENNLKTIDKLIDDMTEKSVLTRTYIKQEPEDSDMEVDQESMDSD